MKGEVLPTHVLSMQYIPRADTSLLRALNARAGEHSLAVLTMDSDDVGYTALDEATKFADVRVLYARSMYAGAANASTAFAGEFIGILAAPDPESAYAGAVAAHRFAKQTGFVSANADNSVVYFAHCISGCGTYLAEQAGVRPGDSLAYLIAPPCEALCALDAAVKAAEVKMKLFYGPPSETNFAGALLAGSRSDCEAACRAFGERVCEIAARPIESGGKNEIG